MKIIAFAIVSLGSAAIWMTMFIPKAGLIFIIVELLFVFSGLTLLCWPKKRKK